VGAESAVVDVYYHQLFLKHETGSHPESKERLAVAVQILLDSGLPLEWVTPVPAPVEEVVRIHTSSYVDTVRKTAQDGGGWLDWDTAVSPDSYDAALLAAGAGIMAVDECLASGRSAFMLIRPPGHHATASKGMGFCLFNNVAIAAAHALEVGGLERVLIVDWDVHHGNGTHDAFYDDPRVLFFSIHEDDHYPGTGAVGETGAKEGAGYTLNVPLRAGDGDGALLLAFESLLLPVARAYQPQLVLVSAGYDGQTGDPLGDLCYSERAFQWMAARLRAFCEEIGAPSPLVFLEGGYEPRMMSQSVVATLRGMLGEMPVFTPSVAEIERGDIERAIAAAKPFWGDALEHA
jgi:acetoin utilization deacetylase AcuC-like enzyme